MHGHEKSDFAIVDTMGVDSGPLSGRVGLPTTHSWRRTMNAVLRRVAEQTAIQTQLGAIFVSLELSRSTWLVTSLSPGSGEKMSKHSVRGGDIAGLLKRFSQLQEKTKARTGKGFAVIVIQEAGLD